MASTAIFLLLLVSFGFSQSLHNPLRALRRNFGGKFGTSRPAGDVAWDVRRRRWSGTLVRANSEPTLEAIKLREREAAMAKIRIAEDALLAKLGDTTARIGDVDLLGLSPDQNRIARKIGSSLEKELFGSSAPNSPQMCSLRLDVESMPWWEAGMVAFYLRIAQKAANGRRAAVLFPRESSEISGKILEGSGNIPGNFPIPPGVVLGEYDLEWKALRGGEGADVMFIVNPTLDSTDAIDGLRSISRAGPGEGAHTVVIDGYFPPALPTEILGRQVRARAKEVFPGGIMRLGVVVEGLEIKGGVKDMEDLFYSEYDNAPPRGKGEIFELPKWLQVAGYKATGNLAITGNSGTGKSSLNNAIRRLKPRDPGAAAVGVKETTLFPTGYSFPADRLKASHHSKDTPTGAELKLWDLPGAGTPRFPLKGYIRDMGIRFFDLVVVVASQRYTETDLKLMEELAEHGVPYFAVRSKIDVEIRNGQSDNGATPAQTLELIRNDIQRNSGLPYDRVFLLSSRYQDEYDFPAFVEAVQTQLQRALDVKLAKAMTRKIDLRVLYRSV
ncbi:hypothetical protein AAMO2058_001690000 [Amorphochlora amoebiformis]